MNAMSINQLSHRENYLQKAEEVLINYAKEDPSNFEVIYKAYHEQVFRFIYQRMDNDEIAYDVTSLVFMKALKNIHKYEYKGIRFSSWLFQIARNEIVQAFRDKKAIRTVNLDSLQLVGIVEEINEDPNEENKIILRKCLAKLKPKEIQLIEMKYFEGRTYKEIAEIVKTNENNAKVKTFRALEKLKQLFIEKHNQL